MANTDDIVNNHHNYAAEETHYGQRDWVHRKGATSARAGELGIIPGSMGTRSYIVRGLGNVDSFASCSHGAGRVMGRKEAKRSISMDRFKQTMKGIHFSVSPRHLDEAPDAYKDINRVIANQRDLVEVVTELRPLAVVKG
jgi:tRNA-splicing ligase RtcB